MQLHAQLLYSHLCTYSTASNSLTAHAVLVTPSLHMYAGNALTAHAMLVMHKHPDSARFEIYSYSDSSCTAHSQNFCMPFIQNPQHKLKFWALIKFYIMFFLTALLQFDMKLLYVL